MRSRWILIGGVCGVAAPALLTVVLVGLTVAQRDFLTDSGWSPVARNDVQWPSLLAHGPRGWLMSVGFAATGVLGAALAKAMWQAGLRPLGALLGLAAIGLAGLAFPVDYPADGTVSWHGLIHDLAYPPVLLGTVGAATLVALPPRSGERSEPWFVAASRALVPVILVCLALTLVGEIGQLARYVAFGAMLTWTALAGVDRVREADKLPVSR